MRKLLFAFVALFVVSFTVKGGSPKYIFLFIGDGMAAPQRMIAEEFSKLNGRGSLLLNTLPAHGTTRTSSADALITDSAAAATAIACGVKTNNGMVGVDPDGRVVRSVAEVARDNGRKVGIITSVTLNHATPAGFYGHRRNRSMYYELGLDLIASRFDFFGGGGIAGHDRGDKDIFDLATAAGYRVVSGKYGLTSLKPGEKAIALAGSRSDAMPYRIDAGENIPTLADITAKAIEVLDNPNGFFIMVEGGAIDWAGHANEAAANLFEVLALDEAVRVAYEFYTRHPDETLIVVTGDHETGAMTMGFSGGGYNLNLVLLARQRCSIGRFGEILEQAKADDPEFDFEKAKLLITRYFGIEYAGNGPLVLSAAELTSLQRAFERNRLPAALRTLMNRKAGIGWNSGNHTALPVLTTAEGCGAMLFIGFYENTAISMKLKSLL